jgi:multiple sugar transport system substrate-binding protein
MAVIVLLVVGCLSIGGAPASGQAPARITLKLSTWTANEPGQREWWPMLIREFEATHPGATVDIQNTAFSSYIQTVTTLFTAGSPPDIVDVPLPTTTLPAWAAAGFLVPIDQLLSSTDIPANWPPTQSAMTWGGKTYGVLLVSYGFVLFYNKSLLDAANVGVPTNVEQLLAAAKATTGDGRFGFAVTADSSPNFIRDVLHFVTGMGAPWVTDGKWSLTNPRVVQAVDIWRTLATKYAPQGTDISQKRQAFFDGKVAMMIDGPFVLAAAQANAPAAVKPYLHVAQVPLPIKPGDASRGLAIPTGVPPSRQGLVWDFIRLAASQRWQCEYARRVSSPVARKGADSCLPSSPDAAQIARANTNPTPLVSNQYYGLRPRWGAFATAASDTLHSLLTGGRPTAEALAALQARLEAGGIQP